MLRLKLPAGLQIIKPIKVRLEVLGFGQEGASMGIIPGEEVVAIFSPGEKGRIVRMLDAERKAAVCVLFRMKGLVEIVERLDPRKFLRRVFAEENHEGGIPDPDMTFGKSLIHVGALWQLFLSGDVVPSLFPSGPVEVDIAGLLVEDWLWHPVAVEGFFCGAATDGGGEAKLSSHQTEGGCFF